LKKVKTREKYAKDAGFSQQDGNLIFFLFFETYLQSFHLKCFFSSFSPVNFAVHFPFHLIRKKILFYVLLFAYYVNAILHCYYFFSGFFGLKFQVGIMNNNPFRTEVEKSHLSLFKGFYQHCNGKK
jgi:hypothetical protein